MGETLANLYRKSVAHDKSAAILTKESGEYLPISSAELARRVMRLHAALLEAGLAKGDRCALISENRWEWAVADFAMMTAGIVSVPIYPSLPPDQVGYLVGHSESKGIFCSTPGQVAKIQEVRGELPDLRLVAAFDPVDEDGVTQLSSMIADGDPDEAERQRFDAAVDAVDEEDLASIIYTSGTTGVPKGVMLTHSNMATNVRDSPIMVTSEWVALSFLPLCHVAERLADYVYFSSGATVAYAESIETVAANMGEVQPTVAFAVPRFYEKVYGRVMAAIAEAPPARQKIFHWAVGVGKAALAYRLADKPVPKMLCLKHRIADAMVFKKLRGRLGGKMKIFFSGAAPLPTHLFEFFHALGMPIYEGYGLTETSPIVTISTADAVKLGKVGKVIPNVEVRIAEDGEILVKGPNIMRGYYKMEEQTAEVMDGEWFRTGDIGNVDEEGYLAITDRKKDMFKTSGGKYIVPSPIEGLIKRSTLVGTVVVIAERRNFPSALVVPNFETLGAWADAEGLPSGSNEELCANERVQERMMEEVADQCSDLAKYEQIKKITLIPQDFSLEGGELTPTMKVRRREVDKKYAAQIDAMYA